MDADEIESLVLGKLSRPTARMQVESLVRKIRKEAEALRKVDEAAVAEASSSSSSATSPAPPPKQQPAPAPPPAPAPKPIPSTVAAAATTTKTTPSVTYASIDRFAFDAGTSSDPYVTLYLPLPGVGTLKGIKDAVRSSFTKRSFDVTVIGSADGKNHRLKRDDLEHEIVPEESKHVIKKDKILVKLKKKKGEYGSYDYWTKLTDPKKGASKGKKTKSKSSSDPSAGLMDMMKDLYDSGDDNMRKMIGETMLKQRNGQLNDPTSAAGGLGAGLGDL